MIHGRRGLTFPRQITRKRGRSRQSIGWLLFGAPGFRLSPLWLRHQIRLPCVEVNREGYVFLNDQPLSLNLAIHVRDTNNYIELRAVFAGEACRLNVMPVSDGTR